MSKFHHPSLPASMQTQALQIIHKIVPRRNAIKKNPHPSGTIFAWKEIATRHDGEVIQAAPGRSQAGVSNDLDLHES